MYSAFGVDHGGEVEKGFNILRPISRTVANPLGKLSKNPSTIRANAKAYSRGQQKQAKATRTKQRQQRMSSQATSRAQASARRTGWM